MSEHDRDLAAGAALGALSPEEEARLRHQASSNPTLAAELDEYRATVVALEVGVAREQPPDDLFERVLADIEAEQEAPAQAERSRTPDRGRSWRLWPAFGVGLAAAATAIVLAVVLSGNDELGSPQARAAVSGTEEFPAVRGEARLYRPGEQDGRLVLDLADVPQPAAGEHYEVWVLRRTEDGEMEAVGVFSGSDTEVELELRLPGPGDYEAVDVSVEPDGGSAEHSGRSLAGGRFEQAS